MKSASILAFAAALSGAAPAIAQWVPNETLVSQNPGLIDYEFSQPRAKIAWTDPKGVLWLANVNKATGMFEPWTGKGQQLRTNTVANWNMFMWNGPEWISTASGEHVYFSFYAAGKPKTAKYTQMGVMMTDKNGAWVFKHINTGGKPRMSHIASHNRGDTKAHIKYLDPLENQYWRDLNAGTEVKLDFIPPSTKSWRFASGMRALLYTKIVDGTDQVFRYMLDTKQHQQLTFDAGAKDLHRTVPWQWRAPEFNNDFVLSTVADGGELRVYRQFNGAGPFVLIYSATLPNGMRAGSPEWFTYNGKSYVFMVAYEPDLDYAKEIWLSSIDSAAPLFRRVTDNSLARARNDPEIFITTNHGPLIYYNRYDPSIDPDHPLCAECSEGVYRADPGLLGR